MYIEQQAQAGAAHGRCLTVLLCGAVAAACIIQASLAPGVVDGTRMLIRLTARTSLVLFVLAFTASSLAALLQSPGGHWLRANRKSFGLAFAFSHLLHAVAIVALWRIDPALFTTLTTPASFIAGGLGYAAIAAMAATSSDRTAALVGQGFRRALHRGSEWFLAVFFVVNFGRLVAVLPGQYWPYMALILGAVALRLIVGLRQTQPEAAQSPPVDPG